MNIALIGYGKMGHAIEEIALSRGHRVVLKIASGNLAELTAINLQKADVAIEFTSPETASANVRFCIENGVAVVSGSTGWDEELADVKQLAEEHQIGLIHASNFSIGVNILFVINKVLARMMNNQEDYVVAIDETHHIHKKDAPSGTAIALARQVIEEVDRISTWHLDGVMAPGELPIYSHREDEVPGTHRVTWSSEIDDIDIIHTARSRKGFALGAVLAAEFLNGKKGVFKMVDVLGIKK